MKGIWQRLSKREKGLVALTLFIFLLVLGQYFLVSPLLEWREWVKSQLEIQPQLLEKNLRYIGQKAGIAADLEKARAELKGMEPSLLSGDTPSVNASDLQQTVQGLAAKEGTQVISTRVLNPEAMGTFTRIPIQVEVGGQIDQVANLIKEIESTDKLLVISELNIRSLFGPMRPPRPQQPALPQMPAQNLRASLTIAGFARTQPAAPSKSAPAVTKSQSEESKTTTKGAARQ
ncbi:MAG: type 4a pilus biogenesis protein PilO [Deltaproteobacteria bacterium]|nr:type 4a pilus biogenesis protein PilO [Deltaproteobacteria bacterium]